jgi:NCS1 family nucleobase:cation symporter-1
MIGIAGVLVLKSSDPAHWLRTVGGTVYAVIALSFVAAANLGTAIAGIYSSAVGLRNFRWIDKLPWRVVLLMTLAPVALVGIVIPELFFAGFGAFLAFIGVGFAPLCGIQIADYYVLRRGRIDIRAMFDASPSGAYSYWRGFNPAALAALAAGCAVYVYLLNPITYQSHAPYRLVTASLPTALVSGLLYVALTWLLVVPRGRGGYRRAGPG